MTVIPENKRALRFWRKAIASIKKDNFIEELKLKTGRVDSDQPNRIFLTFNTTGDTPLQDPFVIHNATSNDIESMVRLSKLKRLDYEKAQPQFWRHAPDAEIQQATWFNQLLKQDDHFLFVAKANQHLVGFIIGRLRDAPEVYRPGGLTLEVDDFCVESPTQWPTIGSFLLNELKIHAKSKGATQLLVVCGAHDAPKKKFLQDNGIKVASEWYVGTIV